MTLFLKEAFIMKDLLAAWTLDTIKSNPELYGGDNGNPAIIRQYLFEVSADGLIENLPLESVSNSVSVSRGKNIILDQYPQYDYRQKNKPKPRNHIYPNQGVFPLRDFMTPDEIKITDFLNGDIQRWDWSASRIAKSVRGVNKQAIECILNHKELYQMETDAALKVGA
jgi:hypothetical protein